MPGTLVQIATSNGGMPKLPALVGVVTRDGVQGDWQKNRKYHGGPDRAICLYSVELYDYLRTRGIDLQPGAVGENFTTQGIDLLAMAVGDCLQFGRGPGGCVIQITDVRVPCRNLNQWDPRLLKVINGHSGWVARVLQPGTVHPGDPVQLSPRPEPLAADLE
jgi:MOSC domain-containing protein YiiM